MNKKPNWPEDFAVISEKSVRNALRELRRENGSECVFPFETIWSKTRGRKSDLERILNEMMKAGEVYGHGGTYRLS